MFVETSSIEISKTVKDESVSNKSTNTEIDECIKIANYYADETNKDHNFYFAKFWHEKDLELGSEEGMIGIGRLYYKGHGVP